MPMTITISGAFLKITGTAGVNKTAGEIIKANIWTFLFGNNRLEVQMKTICRLQVLMKSFGKLDSRGCVKGRAPESEKHSGAYQKLQMVHLSSESCLFSVRGIFLLGIFVAYY